MLPKLKKPFVLHCIVQWGHLLHAMEIRRYLRDWPSDRGPRNGAREARRIKSIVDQVQRENEGKACWRGGLLTELVER